MEQLSKIPYAIIDVGGSNIKQTLTGQEATEKITDILTNVSSGIGAILVAVAVMKILLSMADENAKSRADAAMMLASGIFFLCLSGVLTMLGLDTGELASIDTVVENILSVIANFFVYAGIVMLVLTIITLIMSIIQEQPEQQARGVTMLGISIAMLSAKILVDSILEIAFEGGVLKEAVSSQDVINTMMDFLIGVASYIGGGFVIFGILRIVMGIRTEDSRERDSGIKFLGVGVALIAFRIVLGFFGLVDAG